MKVLMIDGSHRQSGSNTFYLLGLLMKEFGKDEMVQAEIVSLRDIDVSYCLGCDRCFGTGKPCVLDDGMKELYEKLISADVIVIGSPNYFKNVSGRMKTFMDRTNALVKPAQLKGKKAVVVCVGGQAVTNTMHCENVIVEFFYDHGMDVIDTLVVRADRPNEAKESPAIAYEVKKLAAKIFEPLK